MQPHVCDTLLAMALFAASTQVDGQTLPSPVPEWAQPGTATLVAAPPDFHRAGRNFDGIFKGQSDVGRAVFPGSATCDAGKQPYTIDSAGYNNWYTRDEFRNLWQEISGDVSLPADISFPNPTGCDDRKAVLIIRQDPEDDPKEALAALQGLGMIHIAYRAAKEICSKDMEYRIGGPGIPDGANSDNLVTVNAQRIGIEKRRNSFAHFVSVAGEPMHQFGPPVTLRLDGPSYIGIGFCSRLPDKVDTAIVANIMLDNFADKVR